jgi:hypothetical protein
MKKLGAILILAMCSSALAQNLTSVSATKIQGNDGTPLANGQICFLMTDGNDQPVSVQGGGGGQITKAPVCKAVTNGGITTFNIFSTTATSPANTGYRITVKDTNTSTLVIVDKLVSISGASFNFDNYTPTVGAVLAPLTGTAVSGNLSVTGNISATGTVSATNIPAFFITTLQDSTVALTQRSTLNFQQGLKAKDNAPSTRTDVSANPPALLNAVTFSATPQFDCALGNIQKIILTANVTSSTILNCSAGMEVAYEICQDATGGRTFVPPANLNQWATIPSGINACSVQIYFFETATVAYPDMMPGLTGDVTSTPGTVATTLANSGVSAGTCGEVVVDAKGRTTTCTAINATARGGTGQNSTAVFPTTGNVLTDVNTFAVQGKSFTGAASGNTMEVLNFQGTLAAVVGTGADANLFTFTIPANTIAAGKGFVVSTCFKHTTGTASVTYKIKLGATTIFGGVASTDSTNDICFESDMSNNIGVQNAQTGRNYPIIIGTAITAAGGVTTAAENTANSLALAVTFAVAATDQVTPKFFKVSLRQ